MINDNTISQLKSSKAIGAMLGAAYGDALGWPNERVGRSNSLVFSQSNLAQLRKWTRRVGGRFYPRTETIEAGEYSDDTQLILCLSRSLLKGNRWWDEFTQVELPFWTAYERGGGSATKKAANSWLDGVEPWNSKRRLQAGKEYFDTGGNGVAMRVLPHVLRFGQVSFEEVASNIFLDGITTHGHPRALLGALVYGFALWSTSRKNSSLRYGEIFEELLENTSVWSNFPLNGKIGDDWLTQTETYCGNYLESWSLTRNEILEFLSICQSELSKGAVAEDNNVLEQTQSFNKQMNGAGTVAATSAVYFASRYASHPINGLKAAAYALGTDTDTVASMTGGLFGTIHGADWITSIKVPYRLQSPPAQKEQERKIFDTEHI